LGALESTYDKEPLDTSWAGNIFSLDNCQPYQRSIRQFFPTGPLIWALRTVWTIVLKREDYRETVKMGLKNRWLE
jgi:hypothetical protein